MEKKDKGKLFAYLPILAYLGFWLQGCLVPSFMTHRPALVALGIVTAPAIIALAVAASRINKSSDGEK